MITSAEEFHRLRTSESPEDYRRAAHEDASLEVWLDVIARYPDMREWVAHNKAVPLNVLKVLASDGDAKVRSTVARKRKLDRELMDLLSRDPDESVRHCLACNAKTSLDVLRHLSDDPQPFVARAASERLITRSA